MLSRRFRIERVLGVGAMGIVVAAHHLALDVRVAIKLMLPELRSRKNLVARFVREARAAARLTSPHVARVLDVGTLEDSAPYIVMEYLEGTDLATQLRQRGPVSAARAAAIALEASHALAEAHALGIIHRDLKPANLFVAQDRDLGSLVKVLDLGICRVTERADELGNTSVREVVGTPVYMAPEQLRSARDADARSDIWSLGVILYELVTGRVPFRGRTLADQCAHALLDPYPAMNVRGVPRAFEAIVARCLAKNPSARFQRMAELAAELRPLASQPRPDARALEGAARRPPVRRRVALAVAAVAAVVVIDTGALGSRSGREAAAPAPGAPASSANMIEDPRSPMPAGKRSPLEASPSPPRVGTMPRDAHPQQPTHEPPHRRPAVPRSPQRISPAFDPLATPN